MGMDQAMIVAGIGCRKGTAAAAIEAAINAALARAGLAADALALIATSAAKRKEPGIADAAARLGRPVVFIPQCDLEAEAHRGETHSQRVMALTGVPSVAEAAALAAAGAAAKLIASRIAIGPATCALAEARDAL